MYHDLCFILFKSWKKLTRKVLRTQDAQISLENMLSWQIKTFRSKSMLSSMLCIKQKLMEFKRCVGQKIGMRNTEKVRREKIKIDILVV